MPSSVDTGGSRTICAVFNCHNSYRALFKWKKLVCGEHLIPHADCACLVPFSLHRFPKDENIRQQWIKAVNRKDFHPKDHDRICSVHFFYDKPTKRNPVPQRHLGYESKVTVGRRTLDRKPLQEKTADANTFLTPETQPQEQELQPIYYTAEAIKSHDVPCQTIPVLVSSSVEVTAVSTQTNDEAVEHSYAAHPKHQFFLKTVGTQTIPKELVAGSISTNTDSLFYTGLTLPVYLSILQVLEKHGRNLPYKLSARDQILLTLMRLRLALPLKDLSNRFGVSVALTSNIFNTWVDIMAKHLKDLIVWLPRDTIQRTLPKSFKESYPKTTVIVDCTEVFIQRPFSLKARAQTYSTYKSHNTAKFLVGIAPNGYIMFVSHSYGGRASDRFITKSCGFLDYLEPGDEVMADRGFTISEDLFSLRVKLNMPAFMKGRSQLTDEETTESRRIAAVRIHVERAIARIKSFKILNSRLPIAFVKKVDNIMVVCTALCNLRGPLIKGD